MIDANAAVENFGNRCLCNRHFAQLLFIQIQLHLFDIMELCSTPCDRLQNTQLVIRIIIFQCVIKVQGYDAVFNGGGL